MSPPTKDAKPPFTAARRLGAAVVRATARRAPSRAASNAARLRMGRHSYGRPIITNIHLGDDTTVDIGAFCSIADGVEFSCGGNHRKDWVTTFPFRVRFGLPGAYRDGHPSTRGDIRVGNDVWIGSDALVLSGVAIGDGAVVGARAVVSRDVRPYAVVVGNPAREASRRHSDAVVDSLLQIRWWDWPDEKVLAHLDQLSSSDSNTFVSAHTAEPTCLVCRQR